MNIKSAFLITGIAVALTATGCMKIPAIPTKYNPYPIAEYPETEYQLKLQAAAQWQALAEHQALAISNKLSNNSYFYIRTNKDPSAFELAYSRLLKSSLVTNGFLITTNENSADHIISCQTQVIQYKNRDKLRRAFDTTILTAAYLIASNLSGKGLAGAAALSIVGIDTINWADSKAPTPNVEIIMTTDIDHGDSKVYSNTSVYYLNADDVDIYNMHKYPTESTLSVTDV